MIVTAVYAVYFIVGAHHCPGLSFLHGDFKGGQVDLPQRPLVDLAVRGEALVLLTVAGEVLQACADPVFLHPPDVACAEPAGQVRILREVLETASAQRIPPDADAGAQHESDLVGRRFLAYRFADLREKRGIPAAAGGRRGRKARRGIRTVHPQHICESVLLSEPVGSVGGLKRRDPVIGMGLRMPEILTGAQLDLRFYIHPR